MDDKVYVYDVSEVNVISTDVDFISVTSAIGVGLQEYGIVEVYDKGSSRCPGKLIIRCNDLEEEVFLKKNVRIRVRVPFKPGLNNLSIVSSSGEVLYSAMVEVEPIPPSIDVKSTTELIYRLGIVNEYSFNIVNRNGVPFEVESVNAKFNGNECTVLSTPSGFKVRVNEVNRLGLLISLILLLCIGIRRVKPIPYLRVIVSLYGLKNMVC